MRSVRERDVLTSTERHAKFGQQGVAPLRRSASSVATRSPSCASRRAAVHSTARASRSCSRTAASRLLLSRVQSRSSSCIACRIATIPIDRTDYDAHFIHLAGHFMTGVLTGGFAVSDIH